MDETTEGIDQMTVALPRRRWRIVLGGLAAALLLVLVVGTPQGRGVAAELLAQFRSERPEALSLSTGQIANLQDVLSELEHLGTLHSFDTLPELDGVESIAEASRLVGFNVLQPDTETLPAGIDGTPATIRVMPAHELRFTVDLEKARAHYQSMGHEVSLPDQFQGTSLVVNMPPAVLLVYANAGSEVESASGIGLVIGQAGTITTAAEGGVTLEELRNFLVDLPGLSPEITQELRRVDEWRTTLPIPIPADQIAWQRATIAGSAGLLLNDNTGLGSAAIWQRDGRIFAIAGAVKAEDIQRVAETLR